MKKISLRTYRRIKNLLEKTSNFGDALMVFFLQCSTGDTEYFIEYKLQEKELFKAEIVEQLIDMEKLPDFLCNYRRKVIVNWADIKKPGHIRCDAHIRSIVKMADSSALQDYKLILTDAMLPLDLQKTLVSHIQKLEPKLQYKNLLPRSMHKMKKRIMV